jgi:hypothetical protein
MSAPVNRPTPALDATQLLPAPLWSDPRVHLLDDLWLLTLFAMLFAAGVPWFLGALEVRVGAALLGLTTVALIHFGFTALATPASMLRRWRRGALLGLHAAGIVAIGYTWLQVGGLQNPLFLAVFALPIIGAAFLSRWQPYAMAALALTVVTLAALEQAPELRWYASAASGIGAWLAAIFNRAPSMAGAPFPGFYAPSGYFVVLLEVFGILLFACAVAAEYLGSVFDRLYQQSGSARAEAERAQELWIAVIEQLPSPAALVDANTLQVICASEQLAEHFCRQGAPMGRGLLEAVQFSFPEIVQELVRGSGGAARHVALRVDEEVRLAEVHVQHLAHRGRRYALVLIDDLTEQFAVRAALDASEYAALVIDSRDRVLAFNKPALALFAEAQIGADACRLLAQPETPTRWWEPGLASRRKMLLRIVPRVFQVTSSAVALPGEDEHVYVITFQPVARAESNAPSDAGLTRSTAVRGS